MTSQKVEFAGSTQAKLAGVLELPEHRRAQAYAVFAHCFTCGKNSLAAVRISRALAERGIATLRFDFTGLGDSEGELGNAGFAANVANLVAAVHWLDATHGQPTLLVGHSLGGTAALLAAHQLTKVKAVCTIGAPSTANHVLQHLMVNRPVGDTTLTATIGGRTFPIWPSFIEELRRADEGGVSAGPGQAQLVLHSSQDAVVAPEEGWRLFDAADPRTRSFVNLEGADHLLSQAADAAYAADLIAAWGARYLFDSAARKDDAPVDLRDGEVWIGEHDHVFWRAMRAGAHHLDADEPLGVGGGARGPTPYDLLLMALGACTSMTLRRYALRKGYALSDVQVRLEHERIHAQDCAECGDREGKVERITRVLQLHGPLSQEQRADLVRIADRCPVHRTLENQPLIVTRLAHDD